MSKQPEPKNSPSPSNDIDAHATKPWEVKPPREIDFLIGIGNALLALAERLTGDQLIIKITNEDGQVFEFCGTTYHAWAGPNVDAPQQPAVSQREGVQVEH